MIIKSMSRKDATFGALVAYVDRIHAADHRFALAHNLLASDRAGIVGELLTNGSLLKARKNGVVMYHEIISITRSSRLKPAAQKEALRLIALDYIGARAPQCLVYGQLHDDHAGHLHYHLVVSANAAGQQKRHTLTRQAFRKIQVDLEQKVLQDYPQLEQTLTIGKTAAAKQSQAGAEMVRHGKKQTHLAALQECVSQAFKTARSQEELFTLLTDAGLELYTRGKHVGVRDLVKERNHRLDTLGLGKSYAAMNNRFQQPATKVAAILQPQQVAAQVQPTAQAQAVPVQATAQLQVPGHAAAQLQAAQPQPQSQPPPQQAQAMPVPAVAAKTPGPLIGPQGHWRALKIAAHVVQGAEKVVGAAARHGGAVANQVLGGAVKHATGFIEMAAHAIGGPKPHQPKPDEQQAAPVPAQHQPPLVPRRDEELERIARERGQEMDRMLADQQHVDHQQAGQKGPAQT